MPCEITVTPLSIVTISRMTYHYQLKQTSHITSNSINFYGGS